MYNKILAYVITLTNNVGKFALLLTWGLSGWALKGGVAASTLLWSSFLLYIGVVLGTAIISTLASKILMERIQPQIDDILKTYKAQVDAFNKEQADRNVEALFGEKPAEETKETKVH